jgi:type VI protein secretion system component VasK
LTGQILDKFSQLITTVLGLVAALAWNEAIQQLFRQVLGEAGGALAAKLFYAFVVTIIVIFATIAVSRAAERAKKREEESEKGLLSRLKDWQRGGVESPSGTPI